MVSKGKIVSKVGCAHAAARHTILNGPEIGKEGGRCKELSDKEFSDKS